MWQSSRLSEIVMERDLKANLRVCPHCGHHSGMPTAERMSLVLDEGSFVEHDIGLQSDDPLEFRVDSKKYRDQLKRATDKAGEGDAFRSGTATIEGASLRWPGVTIGGI